MLGKPGEYAIILVAATMSIQIRAGYGRWKLRVPIGDCGGGSRIVAGTLVNTKYKQ
jgi:hypothetical protein